MQLEAVGSQHASTCVMLFCCAGLGIMYEYCGFSPFGSGKTEALQLWGRR